MPVAGGLTFEGLSDGRQVPTGYGGNAGISFGSPSSAGAFVAADASPGSPYAKAAVSGDTVAINRGGEPVTVAASTGTFDLNSLYATGLATNPVELTITGHRDGSPVPGARQTVTLQPGADPQLLEFGAAFAGVDKVVFTAVDPSAPAGSQPRAATTLFGIDNLSITNKPGPVSGTQKPTAPPTASPTAAPAADPTASPTPIAVPSGNPTAAPAASPTAEPSVEPTAAPSAASPTPTDAPSQVPTAQSPQPTAAPAGAPTASTPAPSEAPAASTPAPTAAPAPVGTAPTPVVTSCPAGSQPIGGFGCQQCQPGTASADGSARRACGEASFAVRAGAAQCLSCVQNGPLIPNGGGDGASCRYPVANAERTTCGESQARRMHDASAKAIWSLKLQAS